MFGDDKKIKRESGARHSRKKGLNFSDILVSIAAFLFAVMVLVTNFQRRTLLRSEVSPEPTDTSTACTELHEGPDGGDCQALQGDLRRPLWACFSAMREALPDFLALYEKRPIQDNLFGMKFDHSFALYFSLRSLDPPPQTVIESGVYKGHGTWLIRQALPEARIISLDPDTPEHREKNVKYLVGDNFIDVGQVNWNDAEWEVNPATTVVFIDDHQSAYRRTMLELAPMGFTQFLIEDNYPYLKGDNMSFKWTCELNSGEASWPGTVPDDFKKKSIPVTWEQHVKHASYLPGALENYYEFPPLASSEISGQRRFEQKVSSKPIITDQTFFSSLGLDRLPSIQFNGYTHFLYLKVKSGWVTKQSPPGFGG